jgi:HlyD family secretion protein
MSVQPLPATGAPPDSSRTSLDQLDTLVRVTTIQAWVYLATLFTVCVAAVVLAFVYKVPTKVSGEGILLIENDTLSLVRSQATGRLIELHVKRGDEVKPDLIIGEVSQDDLLDSIKEAETKLHELQCEDSELTAFEQAEKQTRDLAMAQVKRATRQAQKNAMDKLKIAQNIVESTDRLRRQHHLGDLDVLSAKEKMYDIHRDINSGDTRLAELDLDRVKADYARGRSKIDRRLKIGQIGTKLGLDREKLSRTSHVLSKARGRVAEVLTAKGELVREGSPILLLHSPREAGDADDGGRPYDAIVFVPAGEGKKIEFANRVEVAPATVKREEYGFIQGHVVSISELPATKLAMEAALAHPELVDSFLKRNAPGVLLRVHVKLDEPQYAQRPTTTEPDPARKNRFLWSSSSGREQPLKTGTMCQAAIVVQEKRLISLLLPWIKTQTGTY